MVSRIVSGIMVAFLLVGMLTLAFNIRPVKASGTIYIRADGSIDPSDAPISTVDNVTYTLTGNITCDVDGIIVERDNIILEGAGYAIQETVGYDMSGICLDGRSEVTIKNVTILKFKKGVSLISSSNNSIVGNNITNNFCGVTIVSSSSNNSISGNNITNNITGIALLTPSSNNKIFHNNFINNNIQVLSDSADIWDDGYPSGGNYWSDYTGADLYNGPTRMYLVVME